MQCRASLVLKRLSALDRHGAIARRALARLVPQSYESPNGGSLTIRAMATTTKKDTGKRNETKQEDRPIAPPIPGLRSSSPYGSLGEPMRGPGSGASAMPWQAADNVDVQRVTQQALIYELSQQQTSTIQHVVPWFLDNMPPSYFRQVPERYRMDHIKAIAAVKDANMDLYLNLKAQLPDGRQVLTFIRPGTAPGTLLHMVEDLPFKHHSEFTGETSHQGYMPLTRLHVFSAKDETMSLNMFVYGESPQKKNNILGGHLETSAKPILDFAERVQQGESNLGIDPHPLLERDELMKYLPLCSDNYVQAGVTEPRRFLRQRLLFNVVSGTEGTAVHMEVADPASAPEVTVGQKMYWVDVAVANSMPQVALEHLCRLLFLHRFDVMRARLDVLPDAENGSITLLRMLVAPVVGEDGADIDRNKDFEMLARELKRSKWLDPFAMDLVFDRYPWLGVTRGEIITLCCSLMHPIMAKENAIAYSKANILDTVTNERFIPHAAKIADLFLDRFNPKKPLSNADFQERSNGIRAEIESDVEDTGAAELLNKMLDVVHHTLKTNVYMQDRYALGVRLDPRVMVAKGEAERELPYGVFFVHGRRFNAFHVRFRDISRGGMRLVTPPSPEQLALEATRQYDECYGLAFAQQLKNKDIPEGGSKAVNLIDTNGLSESGKNFVMRKSVKAFTDTILDLIVSTDETKENIVDLYGKKEVLYLGPDEQVIPYDINWVIRRAAYRGYDTPPAFMSSKPRAGINHKEYGVTSEGVNVYLDVALRHVLGIDPTKDSFTVKLTGGPDGDVAGNEIKILFREYGENAKIVGVADHSGCAEDPSGLDHEELERLVDEGLCISHFDANKLGTDGVLHTCDTPDGVKARNSMHNRLQADAFVPCGGRPNTIDITNYRQFLDEDGKPTSPLVVEGANLFITAEARQALFEEAGVVIVKDSSANKGGVITSSYEICAAMLATEEEFFQNKEQIVEEVLAKVRGLAKQEALLVFREFENFGGSLPEVSEIVSRNMNTATDALSAALDTLSDEDREALLPLFREHLPKTLADMGFDKVHERVPDQYIKNAISSCLASKMVYKEGTKFIEAQPKERLAAIALKYIEKEKEVLQLSEALESADIPEEKKRTMIELLKAGGARTALGVY